MDEPDPTRYYHTALVEAAGQGYDVIVRLLLSNGANVDGLTRATSTSTLMIEAARSGFHNVVEILIEHGAGFSVTNSVGRTALDYAKHPEVAAVLLKYRAKNGKRRYKVMYDFIYYLLVLMFMTVIAKSSAVDLFFVVQLVVNLVYASVNFGLP